MAGNFCTQCGAAVEPGATSCKYCGEPFVPETPQQSAQAAASAAQQPIIQNVYVQQPTNNGVDPSWPIKSKMAAGLLGIFLGGIGIHKFYLGKIGMGVLYLIFCWTGIPAIIGFIEGIIYLCSDDHNFQVKNRVRIS